MRKSFLGLTLALSAVALLGLGDTTSAAPKGKKMTYEQAFADCQAKVKAAMPGETTQSAPRYTMGRGCMKDHGYRLKKGGTF
jgi:hypothetical protein